jgi:hypothetical protein
MKTKRLKSTEISVCVLFFALISVQAQAENSAEFQQSLKLLRQSQQMTDRKLIQLGVKPRMPVGDSDHQNDDNENKTIFVIHSDGRQLRAHAGKLLFGKVLNRLVVSGDDVPAIIELDQGQGLFSELRALGKARVSGTEGRISIEVNRIVTRPGTSIAVKGSVQDEDGAFGLEAQVLNSKTLALIGSMAGSLISGVAASQQTTSTNAFGFEQTQHSGRNAILQGIAQTGADQSKRLIDQMTQEKPILLANAGTKVVLYLDEEVRF